MKFEALFNVMKCDFFEIEKKGKIEKVEYESSGKMLLTCKKYFDDIVVDFCIIKSKENNELGLFIRLM